MVTTSSREAGLPQQLNAMDFQRLRAYQDNLAFYKGEQWAWRPRRGERQLTFNYVQTFVDKLTAYLMSDLRVVVNPTEETPGARDRARHAQGVLNRVYDENNLGQLDFDTEIDCAVLGDSCYKVTWDPEEGAVRVSAPDVQGLFAWAKSF